MTTSDAGQQTDVAERAIIRAMRADDLDAADRIVRLAFGTFLGLPDPMAFMGDAGYVHTRWRAENTAVFAAELGGELVGSNFVTRWGSVGFFGPLSVRPDLWNAGIAQQLLVPTVQTFVDWGVTDAALYTFPDSAKHVHLYQKFDFWPRYLTSVMTKPVASEQTAARWTAFSATPEAERAGLLEACRALTDAVYPGFAVNGEIAATAAQGLGETVLLWDGDTLAGLAVCHCGPGTEAGSGVCFAKAGAVRPGPSAGDDFDALLAACEALAAERGLERIEAGVNTVQRDAYQRMMARGFRTQMLGIAMQRGGKPIYNTPDRYVLGDWR